MFDNINKYQIKNQSLLKSRIISLYDKNHLINNVPKVISINSLDNKTILLSFDLPISSPNLSNEKNALTITGQEELIGIKTYEINSVEYRFETFNVNLDLTQSLMSDTEIIDVTQIQLMEV